MRKKTLSLLVSPNNTNVELEIYANELVREEKALSNLHHEEILDTDDIKSGFLINRVNGNIFPIHDFVLSLLSDEDIDNFFYKKLFTDALKYCPEKHLTALKDNIAKLDRQSDSEASIWNKEEMKYYDEEVNTEAKRLAFLKDIQKRPLWHIFLERKEYLIDQLKIDNFCNKNILEIGSGNSRTVSWIFHPEKFKTNYIGTDISFQRLILAKQVIPEGEFIQCSAFNLPFHENIFDIVLAFGMLHHLPNPVEGMKEGNRVLKNSGVFALHEPISKPKLIKEGGLLYRMFQTYEHSNHDNDLDWQAALDYANNSDWEIQNVAFSGSLLRTLVVFVYNKVPLLYRQKWAWNILLKIDSIFNKIFSRKPNALGPKGVFAVFKK